MSYYNNYNLNGHMCSLRIPIQKREFLTESSDARNKPTAIRRLQKPLLRHFFLKKILSSGVDFLV